MQRYHWIQLLSASQEAMLTQQMCFHALHSPAGATVWTLVDSPCASSSSPSWISSRKNFCTASASFKSGSWKRERTGSVLTQQSFIHTPELLGENGKYYATFHTSNMSLSLVEKASSRLNHNSPWQVQFSLWNISGSSFLKWDRSKMQSSEVIQQFQIIFKCRTCHKIF